MHTEVLQVAGEEQGAEQFGFGQDIKKGPSKPLKGSSLTSSPILYQHNHPSFLKTALLAHPEPTHLRLSSAPLQNPIKRV